MRYYPVNLDLTDKKCAVIGGGAVAERKVRRLLECGARVMVISPVMTRRLKVMADKGKIAFRRKKAVPSDLKGAYLVVAASGDRSINSAASDYCQKNRILINVVDSPRECGFILPSIVRRGDLTIAISTGGVSPALSKNIRRTLEKAFGSEYAGLLRMMKRIRPLALKAIKNPRSRRRFFNKMVKGISGDAGI